MESLAFSRSIPGGRFKELAVTLIALMFLFIRAPDALLHPVFWAEDGADYWPQQFQHGWAAVFDPNGGYLVTTPRLVAGIAAFAPAEFAPQVFNWLAFVTLGWLYWSIARLDIQGAIFLPLIMACTPTTGEILINATNLQWHISLLLPLAAFSSRLGPGQLALLALASLTGPFAVLAAPIWLIRALKANRVGTVIVIVGAIAQVVTLINADQKSVAETGNHLLINLYNSLRQSYGVLTGERGMILALAFMAATLALAFRSWTLIGALAFGVAIIALANIRFINSDTFGGYGGARYFYALNCFSIWTFVVAIMGRQRTRYVGLLAVGVIIGSYSPRLFQREPLNSTGNWPVFVEKVRQHEAASVAFAPWTLVYEDDTFSIR